MEFELTNYKAEDVIGILKKLSERKARSVSHMVDVMRAEQQGYIQAINDAIDALIQEKK